MTGDKDMSQLVGPNVQVYDIAKEHWLDETGVREKFGVSPAQIPDLLALHGDHVMAYKQYGSSPPGYVTHLAQTFLLKLGIANRQHFIHHQNFRFQM